MFFDANGFLVMFPAASLKAPAEGQDQQGQEPLNALAVAQVSVLRLKPRTLRHLLEIGG